MEVVTIARWSQHTGRPLQSSGLWCLVVHHPEAPVSQYVKVIVGLHINSEDQHSVGHHLKKKKQCAGRTVGGIPWGRLRGSGRVWGVQVFAALLEVVGRSAEHSGAALSI